MQTPKMVNQKALSCLLILTGALVLVITVVLLQTPDTVQGSKQRSIQCPQRLSCHR